nr:immunoglobulin light chain junction region [Macaca mulatta]MOW42442.1 immunoglobulin light chain junction region [Macaca mulatta]MOW43369.1 immunoglobulin light chain junction region [Macaca mulatta]MOW43945.1 immunoglobulin light chain junction region [Macaca mulatta]MOW44130.1 immunoglobulin light chain junction region [Macaca mulatta]
CQQHNSYPPSF